VGRVRASAVVGSRVETMMEELHTDSIDGGHEASYGARSRARERAYSNKSKSVGWAEAAAVPLSALMAWQGLFEVVGLGEPDFQNYKEKWQVGLEGDRKRVLITGSSGGVGVYLVQPTVLAGAQIMAATSSNVRNASFLRELGADEAVEYSALHDPNLASSFDIIIDSQVLQRC
jgi:NADPH:quinone reductase-like Zn-dependent oxidoreductase